MNGRTWRLLAVTIACLLSACKAYRIPGDGKLTLYWIANACVFSAAATDRQPISFSFGADEKSYHPAALAYSMSSNGLVVAYNCHGCQARHARIVVYDVISKRARRQYDPDLDLVLTVDLDAGGQNLAIVGEPFGPSDLPRRLLLFSLRDASVKVLASGEISGASWDAGGKYLYVSCGFLNHQGSTMPDGCYVGKIDLTTPGATITEIARGTSIIGSSRPSEYFYLNPAGNIVHVLSSGKGVILPVPRKMTDLRFFSRIRHVSGGDSLLLSQQRYWGDATYLVRAPYTSASLVLGDRAVPMDVVATEGPGQ